jgi:hypothetical protein
LLSVPILVQAEPDSGSTNDQIKAEQLVRTLGDRSYKAREKAAHELLQMGKSAFVALQMGLQDNDPEVRNRCRLLWPRAFDLDLHARVDDFLADTDGKKNHDLPGWERYRKLVGDSTAARELFAKMVRAEGRMMEQAEHHPEDFAPEKLAARCQLMQQLVNNPRADLRINAGEGEYAQVLFLSSNPKIPSTQQSCQLVGNVLYQPMLQRAITSGEHADILKKLVIAFFERHVEESPNVIYQMNSVAMQVNMKELLDPALKVAVNPKVLVNARATALTLVGRLGTKEHIARLEPIVADNTLVGNFVLNIRVVPAANPPGGVPGGVVNNQVRSVIQLGDVALAMVIHLNGQKPGDFGYDNVKANPNYLNSYAYLGFSDDAARAEARRKWKEWLDKNKEEKK